VDVDPIFCEIAIRRLEHYRATGQLGWQNGHSFENEIDIQFEPTPEEQDKIVPTNRTQNLRHAKNSQAERVTQPALL
jgi:hypothetical protein